MILFERFCKRKIRFMKMVSFNLNFFHPASSVGKSSAARALLRFSSHVPLDQSERAATLLGKFLPRARSSCAANYENPFFFSFFRRFSSKLCFFKSFLLSREYQSCHLQPRIDKLNAKSFVFRQASDSPLLQRHKVGQERRKKCRTNPRRRKSSRRRILITESESPSPPKTARPSSASPTRSSDPARTRASRSR